MTMLAILSYQNMVLKTNYKVLQNRLKLLEAAENQIKESLEDDDIHIEGIFISNTHFNQ